MQAARTYPVLRRASPSARRLHSITKKAAGFHVTENPD